MDRKPTTSLRFKPSQTFSRIMRAQWKCVLFVVMGSAFLLGVESANAKDSSAVAQSTVFPATPRDRARSFAEATKLMDATKIVALASKQTTVFSSEHAAQRTADNEQNKKDLEDFYGNFRVRGKGIAAADYSITQFSDDFAFVRFTWEVSQVGKAEVLTRINSSYLLRLEQDGWRFVGVIELGPPKTP